MPGTFVWGRGGAQKTPEELAREREMADALINQGLDFSPVGSWTQGLARVANAAAGAFGNWQLNKQEQEGRKSADDAIAKVFAAMAGGGDVAPPATSEANYAPGAVTAAQRQPAPESPGGIGSFTAAGGGAPGGVVYANQNAIRSQPIVPDLQASLGEAVQTVYGPGYTAQVYSGGQPAEGRRTGSVRHNGGRAADVYIVGPDGKRITGDALAPLGQYWAAKKYGGVGMEMHGGGIHLDDWSTPPPGGGMTWNYADKGGTYTPAMAAALEMGQKGQLPALNGQQAAPASAPPADAIQRVADAGPSIPQLMQAANNPWLSDGQRMVVGALLKQAMERSAPPEYSTTFAPNGDLLRTDNRGGTPQVLGNYAKPDAPEKPLVIGGKLVDPKTYQVLGDFTPPPAQPADIQEYEYAKGQGFQGSFLDYQTSVRKAGATNVDARNMGTIPPGYTVQYDEKGNPVQMAPIPGGPASIDAQKAADVAKNRTAADAARGDLMTQEIDRALTTMNAPGILPTTGAGAWVSGIPGTNAHDLSTLLDTIKANIGFDQLNKMRQASPTGGALGAVSDQENRMLQSVAGSVDQSQSPEQLRDNLNRLWNVYQDTIHGPGNGPKRRPLSFEQRGQNGTPPAGVDPEIWKYMTPEERKLWQ